MNVTIHAVGLATIVRRVDVTVPDGLDPAMTRRLAEERAIAVVQNDPDIENRKGSWSINRVDQSTCSIAADIVVKAPMPELPPEFIASVKAHQKITPP